LAPVMPGAGIGMRINPDAAGAPIAIGRLFDIRHTAATGTTPAGSRQAKLARNTLSGEGDFSMNTKPTYAELKAEIARLEEASRKHQRTVEINRTLFKIASAVSSTPDLDALFRSIHATLGTIIDTTNFYIALYDPACDGITFPYCVDEMDGSYLPRLGISRTASLTGDVIRQRRPAMLTREEIEAWRKRSGLNIPACSPAQIWLGVPLMVQEDVIGVMAVQSYSDPGCYDQTDMDVMVAAADQVALAIEGKRTTDALQESIERYRALADATFEAIFISDEGICLDTNPTATRMFGYRYEELIGIFGTDVIAPESKALVKQNMLSGYEEPYEVVAQRKDGSRFHAEICGRMSRYRDKKVCVTVVRDIDARKSAEEALRESEMRFRELAEMLPQTIFEVDMEGRLLFVNKNGLEQFGYCAEDLVKGLNAFDMLAREDRQQAGANFARVLAGESIGLSEYTGRRKDGISFPIMLRSSVILRDGTPIGLRGFIIDLTEKKNLERQLLHAQKMEAIGTLAGGIAHDFNNILAAILGFSEMARMDAPQDSPVSHNLDQVIKASYRAKDLVEQILSFSRQKDLKKRAIRISPLVREAVQLLRAALPSTIAIDTDIAEDVGVVDADPTQIHQIVMNLGANAGQAMAAQGGTLRVRLEDLRIGSDEKHDVPDLNPGPYQVLTVSDTGTGVPRRIRQRIFEPYFSTKNEGIGTGMGLAVVHGIVKGHGGVITLQSDGVSGSTFRVYLPVIRGTSPVHDQGAAVMPAGTESILLVDDEKLLTDMGTQMLARLGYRITATNSSLEALELFREQPGAYDLVITDMTMPHLTGDDLARELIAVRPDIPIILCTGFNERISPAKSESIGIRAFLMKPLNLHELAATIRQTLET
jgi:PAS domain S-box-containing protein